MAADLSLEHDFIDRTLRRREPAAHRKGAGDVRGVVVVLAAGVEQQQVPIAQALIVIAIVHDAGIGAAADDRVIGNVRIVRAKLVQQLRHDLVLHAPRAGKAHGAAMGADGDLRRAPQPRLLGTALVQAHVVEHMASATNSCGAPEPCRACTRIPFTQPSMRGSNSRCVPME